MKATKKIGLGICVTGILLTGILMAQGASSSEASTSSTAASGSATTDATSATSTSTADSTTDWTAIIDSDPNTSQLVLVIESDGDLDEVAEAMYLTGTDTLISTMPEGVTIFAPVDGSFDQDVAVEDVITSYIIPGIVDTADMASGDSTTSTAISGDPLTIAVVNEVVTVNGVPVLDAEAIYTDNAVIYKLSDSFASNDLASTK
ncbi:MAG: fasciclin domain-containing protein [Spirochaetaceae bacterium]|nr:fasciclin domain-containing protein [Spirochaetaceae bacterium]